MSFSLHLFDRFANLEFTHIIIPYTNRAIVYKIARKNSTPQFNKLEIAASLLLRENAKKEKRKTLS